MFKQCASHNKVSFFSFSKCVPGTVLSNEIRATYSPLLMFIGGNIPGRDSVFAIRFQSLLEEYVIQ